MKRAALSITCGVLFPFCYAAGAGPLSSVVGDYRVRMLLYSPVGWPRLVASHVFPPLIANSLLENETASLLYIIFSNVLVYTLVTYLALWAFAFKRLATKAVLPPPPNVL
jgi:hypothetical protein